MKVAVNSDGNLTQFQEQVLAHLLQDADLDELSLLPTSGTRFLEHARSWHTLYAEDLTEAQKQKVIGALNTAVASSGFKPTKRGTIL